MKLFAIGLGSAEPARDIELTELLVDDVVFVDDAVRFQAKLLARGFPGEKVTVRLKELEPGSRDPKAAREIESNEVEAPPNGTAEARRAGLSSQDHRRTHLHHGSRSAAPRAPDRQQSHRARGHRAQGEAQGPLRRQRAALRVSLSQELSRARRDDRSERRAALVGSRAYSEQDRSALPTFPAAKDELFAYDVVLFGDADTGYLSQSQMQNLVEFVTEKGGGVLFIAGELFNPLAYRGTPLELLLPIELADARNPTAVGTSVSSYRPELTLEGRASPIFRFGDDEAVEYADLAAAARAVLVLRGSAEEAGGAGPGRASHGHRLRRQAAARPLPVRGRRQGACFTHSTTPGAGVFARATSISAGSGSRRSAFWRGRSWSASVRPRSRPTASGISEASRSSFASAFPTRAWPRRAATSTVQVEHAARARASWRSSSCPARETCSRERCRRRPKENTKSGSCPRRFSKVRSPRPASASTRRSTSSRRIEMNEPELIRAAESTGGKFYTPLAAERLLKDLPPPIQGSARYRSADPALEYLAGADACSSSLITAEWVFRKRKQMV